MKKKILHVNYTMNFGGIESLLMNLLRKIDRDQFEMIFLCYRPEMFDYEKEIEQLGSKVIRISDPRSISKKKHVHQIRKVIEEEKIDIVHCHTGLNSNYVLIASKLAHIKTRIVHVHTTLGQVDRGLKGAIMWQVHRWGIQHFSTTRIACSKEAGDSIYGKKKFITLINGIDPAKFRFREDVRKQMRQTLHIAEEDLVIGHVGRFEQVKNHPFLLEVMKQLIEKNDHYKLVLIGGGEDFAAIQQLAKTLQIEQNVLFLGPQYNPEQYYHVFDYFVFPSHYEGLGIVLIEAQTNGLQCFASQNVPRESNVSETAQFFSLEQGPISLAEKIEKTPRKRNFENYAKVESGIYSIAHTVQEIEKIYRK